MDKKIIRINSTVSDYELFKIIKKYEKQGYMVIVSAKTIKDGYVELIIK